MRFTSKKSRRVPVRVCSLTSGSLSECRSFIILDTDKPKSKNHRSSTCSTLIEDDSISPTGSLHSLTHLPSTITIQQSNDNDDWSVISAAVLLDGETKAISQMLSQLSPDEMETAARSSYAYFQMSEAGKTKDLTKMQLKMAGRMARRHWIAESYNTGYAAAKFKATIAYRKHHNLDDVRRCFHKDDPNLSPEQRQRRKEIRESIWDYNGNIKLFVRGFDQEGRACFHFVGRHSPKGSEKNVQGCLNTHFYILEKAIACSETRGQEKVVVSVDFVGFESWHAPPMALVKEMLAMLKDHYPERLHRVYLMDSPIIFRALWAMIKPFMDPVTKAKFVTVTGQHGRKQHLQPVLSESQAMPYQLRKGKLITPVDRDAFYYELPFQKAYGKWK